MDSISEKEMFRQCHLLNITCITVCHQTSLERFHQQRIALDGEGGWSCSEISQSLPLHAYGGSSGAFGDIHGATGSSGVPADDVENDTLGGTVDDSE